MSKLGLVIVMMVMGNRICAQDYFVLIQSDKSQAFYVRLDSQLYSSTPAGNLILSRLKDSTYTVTIGFSGFSGQDFAERSFIYTVHGQDQELQLRSQEGGGWGLYDQHGLALPAAVDPGPGQPLPGVKRDDAFSRLMAAVVKDTAVMYSTFLEPSGSTSILSSASPRLDSNVAAAPGASHPDSAITVSRDPAVAITVSPQPDSTAAPTPAVVKVSEHRSSQSLRLVYADHPADKKADTIVVIIPVDSAGNARSAVPDSHGPNTSAPETHIPGQNNHALSPDSSAAKAAAANHRKPPLPFVNSDCHNFATDYDVDKLRVKMLETDKDDDRIQTARRGFKTRCFSTMQIRALCEVFNTDAARFRFLEAAYPFCSDEHFPELIHLFADPVYIARFKTMTDH